MQTTWWELKEAAGRRRSPSVVSAPGDRLRRLVVASGIILATMSGANRVAAFDSAVVEMVLDAIDANYGAIDSARLTFAEERRDAGVEEETVTRLETPDGGLAVVTRTPIVRSRLKVWLQADQLRVDRLEGETGENRRSTFVVENNRCTQYVDGHQAAWVRRLGEMPGMLPLDPRQYGVADIRRDFRRIFEEEKIVEAVVARDERDEALVRIVTESSRGQTTTYEFRESAGYLPTRLLTHWPDGSVLQVMDVAYQIVGEGGVRMPGSLTQRFYAEGVAQAPDSPQWRQQMRREVVGSIVVNQKIGGAVFDLQMPEGVRVSDNIRRAVYSIAAPIPSRTSHPGFFWVTAAITLALLLAVLYKHVDSFRPRAI